MRINKDYPNEDRLMVDRGLPQGASHLPCGGRVPGSQGGASSSIGREGPFWKLLGEVVYSDWSHVGNRTRKTEGCQLLIKFWLFGPRVSRVVRLGAHCQMMV